ncbi:MAG: hypothetical protein JRE47_11350 [Deltaproteobacteria bacterium]|nr:hypothetical protein [Deltaproteobacteria bacterium]
MYEQVDKSKENKSRAVANSVAQNMRNVKQGFGFVDNRAEAIAQRELIEEVNNHRYEAPIQGYFEYATINDKKGNLPGATTVSENGNIIRENKKTLFATGNVIDQGNKELESNSKILLEKGPQKDFDFDLPPDERGMYTILLGDYYKVLPMYNPKKIGEKSSFETMSPAIGDAPEVVTAKHEIYLQRLLKVDNDLAAFVKRIYSEWFFQSDGSVVWANQWVKEDSTRNDLLMSHIAMIFFPFQNEHRNKKRLLSELGSLSVKVRHFIRSESENPEAIVLPNDCAEMVSLIVGGEDKRSRNSDLFHSPDIGSNYYEQLPRPIHAETGWNFHWAGVVMKDESDNVTLETAGGLSFSGKDKGTWWFDLYGTKKADQTFKKRIRRTHLERNLAELNAIEKPTVKDLEDIADIKLKLTEVDAIGH